MSDTMEQNASADKTDMKREIYEWAKAFVIAAVLVILIRWLIFSPYMVDGPSMEPNFWTGERVIVDKLIYDFRQPERGEVIVFLAPEGKDFIKRVIGLPGETVQVTGDKVYINGKLIKEPYIQAAEDAAHAKGIQYNHTMDFPATKIPAGEYFVMGDDRPNSEDSRFAAVGFVPKSKIVGRAEFIFWPLKDIRWIKHHYNQGI